MRSSRWLDAFRSAVLVAVLVIAQTAVLTHLDTEDAHPSSESCVLCVGYSTLGAANVAPIEILLPSFTAERPPVERQVLSTSARPLAPSARGPPRNA